MSGAKNHDYHLVDTSVWPLVGSVAALVMFFGLVSWWHPEVFGPIGKFVFGLGVAGLIATFWFWWADVIREAHRGDEMVIMVLGTAHDGIPLSCRFLRPIVGMGPHRLSNCP